MRIFFPFQLSFRIFSVLLYSYPPDDFVQQEIATSELASFSFEQMTVETKGTALREKIKSIDSSYNFFNQKLISTRSRQICLNDPIFTETDRIGSIKI